ncbi:MAG: hypothetical protein ACRD5D_05000, partial [Candidatus Polarisedimenticolia bacterium]
RVMGVAVSRPSVMRLGVRRYFEEVERAARAVPGVVLLPGVEVSPFARFRGSPLSGSLELRDWHRHALVVGLENPDHLAALPITGNRRGGGWSAWSLAFLLPLAPLAWSVRRLARPLWREVHLGGYRLRRRRIPAGAAVLGALSAAVLIAGFPFRVERFGAVGPDPGSDPYRTFAAEVARRGGIVSWAHPEAAAAAELHGVRADTRPYPELVRETDAHAFGALPEGTERLIPPGGLWDLALRDHLEGRRPAPTFALAELDEHRAAGAIDFRLLQTVFLVREKTGTGLLEALRAGRFYARWTPAGSPPLRLGRFTVEAAEPGGAVALQGGSVRVAATARIRLAVLGGGPPVAVRLIRDGVVVWSDRRSPPFDHSIEERVERPTCYRLDVEGPYPSRLLANPIFVLPAGAPRGAA